MDVFAHTLWTNALFHIKYHKNRRYRYIAAFFGVVPDLVGFTPLFVYLIFSGRFFSGEFPFSGPQNWTFGFAEHAYNYTHSLVVFATVFIVVHVGVNAYRYWRLRDNFKVWLFWPMLGWALHILIDIPTHPDFYQTPLFFPISEFRNSHGVAWSHPVFMVVNYSLLILAYIGLYWYQKRAAQKGEDAKQ